MCVLGDQFAMADSRSSSSIDSYKIGMTLALLQKNLAQIYSALSLDNLLESLLGLYIHP